MGPGLLRAGGLAGGPGLLRGGPGSSGGGPFRPGHRLLAPAGSSALPTPPSPFRPPLLHGSPGHEGPDEPSLSPRSLSSPSRMPCPGCPLWWLPGTPPVAACVAVLTPRGLPPRQALASCSPGPGTVPSSPGALRVSSSPPPPEATQGPQALCRGPTNVEQRFFPSLRLLRSRPSVSQHRSPGVVLMGGHRETFRVAACQPASLPAALPSPSGPLRLLGRIPSPSFLGVPGSPSPPPRRPRPGSTRPRSACRVPSPSPSACRPRP